MALRSLLRRIPGAALLPPSGPRMGPVHGVSPPAAARSMGTESQGGRIRIRTAENPTGLLIYTDKEWAEKVERARLCLAECERSTENMRKIGNVATAVAAAVPVLMVAIETIKHK